MKDTPSSPGTSTLSTTQPVLRQRKKPHMLPPLEKRRNSVDCRAEVGSPTPKWRRPSLEEQLILEEPPVDGRPVIRLTRCPDATNPLPIAPTIHISSRYTPLEPIKRRNSQPT
ncbi:hypothetical protein B7P43_G09733 [Cryptotermes secundus]|uniref:Uncharacterized protein n=1 Tax=Cryptotermes secundus TaxID=105785 RepID=A0A2J7Q0E1_9NEOP|nr:uncharacterized protein LOC111870649 [Cryptotermes secundus]PNF22053.1 hypothetical protein B7P43_G09733 [Cryptotermes secundus]